MALKKTSNLSNIIALVLIIVSIVGIFMFILPGFETLNSNKEKLEQKMDEANVLKEQLSGLIDTQSQFVGGEVSSNEALNFIPNNVEQDVIVKTLAKITDDSDVDMNSLSFGLGRDEDVGVNTVTISTNISGSQNALNSFLQRLESSARKFQVNTINVQDLEGGAQNMSLNIEAYYL